MKQKIKANPITMFLTRDIKKLEHNATSQYKFNRFWAGIWALCIITAPFFPKLYTHDIGVLIIIEISLWANFATHFGAMSGSIAAMNTSNKVDEVAEDVDDLHDVTEELHPELLNRQISQEWHPSDIM